MSAAPLTVAWFSQFPVEWLPDAPACVGCLPKEHPSSWQRVLLEELKTVPDLKLHVVVLRKQFPADLSFQRDRVTFHLIKTRGGLRAPSFYWTDTILIRRKLAKIKPDVVHAWGTERGAALVASRLSYPSVVTMQGLLTWINEIVGLPWYHRFSALLERWSLPRVPLVTTESTFAVQYLKTRFACADVRQVEHAPDWMFHRIERRPQTDPLRFLFVGTLSRTKGVDLLLTALDQLKDEMRFELVLVSEQSPDLLRPIRQQTSVDLWKRVQFRQNLPAAEIARELSAATMMVYPTRADNSPNAVKEAVVSGVPVVGSTIGGIPDYVLSGRNGMLFQAGDLTGLVKAIRAACRHPRFRQGLVEAEVLSRMREYLSPALMATKFLEIYRAARRPNY